mmetsp:Transcript_142382/g.246661  ORF Transcript_142382/g.246661 Transcript_142382/m.246661 type:complete len:725 (-) Transcript_142382:56-2230(-)
MASSMAAIIFLLTAVAPSAALIASREQLAVRAEAEARVNPIRRVVSLLQNMQKKITAEGDEELALFEKFGCYCKTSGATLSESIAVAEAKVPEVGSAISETEAKVAQLTLDLKQHAVDRSAAKDAMASAKALRAKEAAAYAKDESELSTNIAALTKAISSIESGMVGAFIQSSSAQALRRVIVDRADMSDFDRELVASFLGAGSHQGYVPKSGQITGILKQLQDSMTAELEKATSEEETAIAENEALMKAKAKEIAANTKAIETKTELLGEAKVTLVTLKDDLKDTQVALEEDKKFLANLDENCAKKTAEHEANMKSRAEELVALADTIKILNDDDALEIFKKTLPSAASSLLQVKVADRQQRRAALQEILAEERKQGKPRPELNFIALAMMGKKYSFEKVLKMIDDMVVLLEAEQKDDDMKKESCNMQFDTLDDKKKELEAGVASLEAMIASEEESIASTTAEIKALAEGIAELDKSVSEATEQRKEEHAEHKELMASDGQAKEVLAFAKNRLNKFYNPDLYEAPPKVELSEEDKIYTTFGGELPAVFAQVSSHTQRADSDVAPPPPPETAAAYKKSAESSAGVMTMIDMLVKDLDKEMTESTVEEEEAQKEYQAFMEASATKRMTDSKNMGDKQSALAALEADVLAHKEEKTATTGELMATEKVIASLHGECDWLLQNFEMRKTARAGEVDSLTKAKAVLSGADYSLVQLPSVRHLRGPARH